jgi:hypothetical protein
MKDNKLIRDRDEWGQLNLKNAEIVQGYLESIRDNQCRTYMITITRDGESPERSVIFYDSAIEAVNVYESYQDWGFAKHYLTVRLYEPNGKINEKILKRPPGIDPRFMRKEYIQVSEIIKQLKDKTDKEEYEKLVINIARIFSKDNPRFDENRFFNNAECTKESVE